MQKPTQTDSQPINQTGQLEALIYELERNQQRTRDSLIRNAKWLADDLTALVKSLEEDQAIPSLGVVQNKGNEIDRLCGILSEYEALKQIAQSNQA